MMKKQVLVEHDGAGVIVNLDSGKLSTLNETGLFVYRLLEAGTGHSQIIQHLTEEFEVEPAEAEADLERFLEQLQGETHA